MKTDYDILGIGNAIMDIIAPVSDAVLTDLDIPKGAMTLIDEETALSRHKVFESTGGDIREIAGGSAANTLAGIAMLGVKSAYIGKVANDGLGERFAAGMRDVGVHFDTKPLINQDASARCLIAVTPDGERTMSTFLGASVKFSEEDIQEDLIKRSKLIYLEGYLFDQDAAKAAYVKASEIAQICGREVSLTLSDPFCVDRHRESFKHLIKNHVDILFANESELLSLYETDDFEAALKTLSDNCKVGCVTRGEKGSVIVSGKERHDIKAIWVDELIDTTGAGDQYAAGVLAGYAMGLNWQDAGELGSRCAAEVISHYGARPLEVVT